MREHYFREVKINVREGWKPDVVANRGCKSAEMINY